MLRLSHLPPRYSREAPVRVLRRHVARLLTVYSPPPLNFKEIPEHVDVALIEGGIRNENNVEEVEEVREAADVVIAVGTWRLLRGYSQSRETCSRTRSSSIGRDHTVNEEGEARPRTCPSSRSASRSAT